MNTRTTHALALALAFALIGCSEKATDEPAAPMVVDRSQGGAMWGENYFPNIPLVSHRGEHTGFFDLIEGKVVAINFIYTKCSDSCPMETARMVEVQRLLGDRMGKDVFFVSISIDPANDTPERLNEYAQTWHTGPGWTFLTGSEADVTALRKKLGVYSADRKKKDHNLSLLIGNQKTGRWMKRSPYENPYVLATQLGSWLHNWKVPSTTVRDYADAPEVRNISSGEEFFRARCATCHTVGGGDTHEVADRRVGPDLLGVETRRPREWLERWIMQPDRMIADKDPTALKLLAQYDNMVMPNFRLTRAEAADVLGYLAEESKLAADDRRGALRGHAATVVNTAPPAAESPVGQAAKQGASPSPVLMRALLAAYDVMGQRLAADDLGGAVQGAAAGLTAAREQGEAGEPLAAMASAVRAVQRASDVAAARLAFGELSRLVVRELVDNPQLREGRYLFRCPMAPGYQQWVQTTETLTNPYWGKRMLHCGTSQTEWSVEPGVHAGG